MSVEELVNRTRAAIPDTFEYDKESDGYYDTPLTHILRENADKLEELAAALRIAQGNTDAAIEDYNEAKATLAEKDKEIAALKHLAEFTARWAWRTEPPHATGEITDAERLSAIKYHPTLQEYAIPYIALAEKEAQNG